MKARQISPRTALAEKAMQRAARNVLDKAVREKQPIPLWDGTKVVWKVPTEEAAEMETRAPHQSGR
jgi:hypothetical protein